jgi:Lhr-like helicase
MTPLRPARASSCTGQHGTDKSKDHMSVTRAMKKSAKTQVEAGIHIDPARELENQVVALREKGMTFKAAGELLNITASRARHLYLRASRRRTGKKPVWTDGLNDRLANLLRWLEFSNREEVAQAFKSGHIQRLALRERGINAANLEELERWLDAGGSLLPSGVAISMHYGEGRDAAEQPQH